MIMPDPLVIWDIDGTIVKRSLERHFIRYLLGKRYITWSNIASNVLSLTFKGSAKHLYQLKLAYLRGKSEHAVEQWISSCWKRVIRAEIKQGALPAINRLYELGCEQIFVSGTLKPLAEMLARNLAIDDVLAAEPEIVSEVYTGRLTSPHPKGIVKVGVVDGWLRKQGRDWDGTIALADHWNDRFLLEKVSLPIPIDPGRKLRKHAVRMGWFRAYGEEGFSSAVKMIENARRTGQIG
ncbi:MAG: HAD-IB family phosphatase [candidate division Zixibacteria bacterium]|nr:HAD-IB family phosphatase [candidate division Zixibacteria bacterium]